MKHLLLLFTLLLLSNSILWSQQDDYAIFKLRKGSVLFGRIIDKTDDSFLLETRLLDTLIIKSSSVRKRYGIFESDNFKGDLPVLVQGRYNTLFVGVGGGKQKTYLGDRSSFIFSPSGNSLPITFYSPVTLAKVSGSMGFQVNQYIGFGIGLNLDVFYPKYPAGIANVFFSEVNVNFNPYVQVKLNYTPKSWGDKDIFMTVNVFRHTEITTGISFARPKRKYSVGFAYYRSYQNYQQESYLTLQTGIQF